MSKHFATVKWVGGEDDGKITVGVPTDFIMNFDYAEFMSDDIEPDETYVIEWRNSKKVPSGGWPKYDGLVLDIATTVGILEKRSRNYVFPKSPRLVPPQAGGISIADVTNAKRVIDTPNNPLKVKEVKRNPRPDNTTIVTADGNDGSTTAGKPSGSQGDQNDQPGGSKARQMTETPRNPEKVKKSNKTLPPASPRTNGSDSSDIDEEQLREPSEEDNRPPLQQIPIPLGVNDVNQLRVPQDQRRHECVGMADIRGQLRGLRELLEENIMRARQRDQPEEDDLVELGQRGSGVTLSKVKWDAAKEQRSFTSMAVTLVMALFPHDVLLVSNVKGGASKIRRPAENPPRHQALDARILEAITVSVRKEFPQSFKTTEMNRAINIKLNTLRREARQAAARVQQRG